MSDARIPKPPRCNPFKAGSVMAEQFTNTLRAHVARHKDMRRGAGNNIASAFWKGVDRIPPITIPRGSLAWACYRAGQYVRATAK